MGFVLPPLLPTQEQFDADPSKYWNELREWQIKNNRFLRFGFLSLSIGLIVLIIIFIAIT